MILLDEELTNPLSILFDQYQNGIIPIVVGEMQEAIMHGDNDDLEQIANEEFNRRECSSAWREGVAEGEGILVKNVVPRILDVIGMKDYRIRFTTEGRCTGVHPAAKGKKREPRFHPVTPKSKWISSKEWRKYQHDPDHHRFEEASSCEKGGKVIVTASYFTVYPTPLAELLKKEESIAKQYHNTSDKKPQKKKEAQQRLKDIEEAINSYRREKPISGLGFRVKQLSALEKTAAILSGIKYNEKAKHPMNGVLRDMYGTLLMTKDDHSAKRGFKLVSNRRCFTLLPDLADYITNPKERTGLKFIRQTLRFGKIPIEIQSKSFQHYLLDKKDRLAYKREMSRQNLAFEQRVESNPKKGLVSPYRVLRALGRLLDFPVFIPIQSPYAAPIREPTHRS